jgi:copper(I)-binding protein
LAVVNRIARAAVLGALVLAPVALSACSAGQIAQTSSQVRDKTGPTVSIGDLELREVELAYPSAGLYYPGSSAALGMAIVNSGQSPDELISVTGPGFTGVQVLQPGSGGSAPLTSSSASSSAVASGTFGTSTSSVPSSAASATPTTPATASGIAGSTGSPSANSSASSSTAATTTGASASSAPSSTVDIAVPAQGGVYLGQQGPELLLTGIKGMITPAQSLQVVLTFRRAGRVTVQAIVSTPSSVLPDTSTFNFEEPEGAATTSSAGSTAGG